MENKPEYRFECQIVDKTTGEIVVRGSTYISEIHLAGDCESIDMEVSSMLRAFDSKVRKEYEGENYSDNKEENEI